MVMHARQAANAYAKTGVETGAMSASPHQLIAMLFDGAHVALNKARWAIEQDDVSSKGEALSKAINILELGLRAALDAEQGGEIAKQLDALYDYMIRTLVSANRNNDADAVAHVDALLEDIGSAWKQIAPVAPSPHADARQLRA